MLILILLSPWCAQPLCWHSSWVSSQDVKAERDCFPSFFPRSLTMVRGIWSPKANSSTARTRGPDLSLGLLAGLPLAQLHSPCQADLCGLPCLGPLALCFPFGFGYWEAGPDNQEAGGKRWQSFWAPPHLHPAALGVFFPSFWLVVYSDKTLGLSKSLLQEKGRSTVTRKVVAKPRFHESMYNTFP